MRPQPPRPTEAAVVAVPGVAAEAVVAGAEAAGARAEAAAKVGKAADSRAVAPHLPARPASRAPFKE